MNANKLTLEDFRSKSIEKYSKRKTFLDIEIEEMGGAVTFSRPTDDQLLSYMSKNSKAVQGEDDGKGGRKVTEMNMNLMFEASKELVFYSCSFLRDIELQKSLECLDGMDVVGKIFGIQRTIEIAGEIADEFGEDNVSEEIKN